MLKQKENVWTDEGRALIALPDDSHSNQPCEQVPQSA